MAEPRISVLILARDEAENLPGCLESVSWADEVVVVVDRASRDQTEAIAQRGADLVAVRTFDDFASQRNAALELASGDWVFAIDADERATPELAAEIRRGHRPIPRTAARRLPRADPERDPRPAVPLLGHAARPAAPALPPRTRAAGSAPSTRRSTSRAPPASSSTPLQHRTIPDMQTFLRKINEYTTLEAIKFEREGRPHRATDLAVRPVWTFLKLYLGKQGFRDGLEGFVFCALSGLSVAVRHWKHRERLRGGRGAS